jgi:hypothetical protein
LADERGFVEIIHPQERAEVAEITGAAAARFDYEQQEHPGS